MNYKTYQQLKKLYDANDFEKLFKNQNGLFFLKVRSITRKELLIEFAEKINVNHNNTAIDLIEKIVNNPKTEEIIDEFIDVKFKNERLERKVYEDKLISELYKLKIFDWGGLYQNNLERTIVDNYIKKIKNFDVLMNKIDNEIHESLKGYVLCSWFNHWTSILIEDIFKEHERVLPTVGLIKKVDFFVEQIPFDLKVTYFPDGFMALKRKEKGLKTELSELKQIAKENKIKFDLNQKNKFLLLELLTKLEESHLESVKKSISEFHKNRWKIIEETIKNKQELIKWLYEEQGERRFDSANRLFLVLIEKNNLEESWKLKRNIDFLKENINFYLDNFDVKNKLKIDFNWKNKKYTAVSDILFVIK